MTPFYQDDAVTIYNAPFDEVAALTGIKPWLVIADPPFDIWRSVVDEIARVPRKTLVAFTTWQHREPLSIFGRPRAELVWTFDDGRWVSHQLPRITHETILVFGEVRDAYVGRSLAAAMPQRKGRGSVGRGTMPDRTWRPRGRALLNSHLAYPRDVSTGVWTKPLPLMEQLIEWLCPEDALIFDPFCGTGSALVAAKNLGRRAVGCDISEAACRSAADRCAQEVLPLESLWGAPA